MRARYAIVLEFMDAGTVWDLLRHYPENVDFFSLALQVKYSCKRQLAVLIACRRSFDTTATLRC